MISPGMKWLEPIEFPLNFLVIPHLVLFGAVAWSKVDALRQS